ncbi:MAG: FAD-dependent oxidoreductase [Planctomycetaceae bacterium]
MNDVSDGESVLIVGAGIVGIACAHYLSQAGFRVTVIDQGTIAGACSHANCGYICPSHVLPLTEPGAITTAMKSLFNRNAPFRVKFQFSPALWNWMWQFAKRCNHRQMLEAGRHLQAILDSSMAEYRKLVEAESLNCQWKNSGLLYVLKTEAGMNHFEETDRLLTEHFQVSARRIPGTELPEFDAALKPGLSGAFHYECDAFVRPDRLANSWASRLKERGVRFLENCRMTRVMKSAGKLTGLETEQGEQWADRYVFAVGAWSGKWSEALECRIPIEPGKGYSVTMSRPSVCPAYPMLFPEHKVGVTPFEDGYRLGSMMEFVGFDDSIPKRRIQLLRKSAEPYLVEPYTDDVQETWYGWRPMTWDSLPIIGRTPKLENVFLATGHNMLGVSLATATGKLIGEMLTGQPTHIDATAFSPARF